MKNVIATVSFFACSALALGCVDSSENEPQLIDEVGAMAINAQASVRVDRSAQGEVVQVVGAGWTSPKAGVWENGSTRLVMGETKPGGSDPTAQVSCTLAFGQGPKSVILPGQPSGVAALAQVTCTGGTAAFTVQSQACVNGPCTPVVTHSNPAVGATPWTAGVLVDAPAGLPCTASNTVIPPSLNSFWSGLCG